MEKDTEIIKQNKSKIKNKISKMKNTLEGIIEGGMKQRIKSMIGRLGNIKHLIRAAKRKKMFKKRG